MKDRPSTAQFTIMGGVVQERGPYIGIYEAGASGQLPLYIMVETSAVWGQDACRRALETVKRVFSSHRMAVTSGLTRAIRAAHEELRAENSRTIAHHRVYLGITCATIKGNSLFLAQAATAQAYILSQRGLKVRSHPIPGEPVGTATDLHIHLHRHHIEEGDRLLLSFSGLSQLAAPEDLESVLHQDIRDAARALYVAARNQNDFSVLVIDLARAMGSAEAPPQRLPSGQRPSPFATAPTLGERSWQQRLKGLALRLPRALSVPLARSLFTLIKRPLRQRRTWLAGAVLIGLAIGAFWYLPGYLSRQADARLNNILVEAKESREKALATADSDSARSFLERAYRLVNDALDIRRGDGRAQGLKKDIEDDLAKINAVFELTNTKVVANLASIKGGSTRPDAFLVAGSDLYALDRASSRIYTYSLNAKAGASATEVIRGGEQVGGSTVESLDKLLWMPSGDLRTQGALLVFDSRRNLFEYSPGQGLRLLSVRGASDWKSFQAAAGYNGSLYVLDPQGGQVWRYTPTESGYDSERRGILSGADISEAVDMAIDGSVYILTRAGKVLKFAAGQRADFTMRGLDKPLSQATVILTAANTKYVYVMDAGNQRVVVFNKDGSFLRQLVHPAIRSLQAFWLDEAKSLIYLLSEGTISSATIPK